MAATRSGRRVSGSRVATGALSAGTFLVGGISVDQSAPKASRWTDDPILDITLKDLFAKGLTFSQIAAAISRLGHKFSRNAVIGRSHRLHMPARPASGGKVKSPEHKQKLSESRRGQIRKLAWMPAADVPPTPSAAGPFLGVPLLDLTATNCRYPHGDQQYTFCGQPVRDGSSYCAAHHRLCYIRSNNR